MPHVKSSPPNFSSAQRSALAWPASVASTVFSASFRPLPSTATSVCVFLCASTPTTTTTAGLPSSAALPMADGNSDTVRSVPHLVSAAPCGASQTAAARGISQTPGGENQTAATAANILIAQTARDLRKKPAPPHLSRPTWTHLPSEPTHWAARILTSHRAGNQDARHGTGNRACAHVGEPLAGHHLQASRPAPWAR